MALSKEFIFAFDDSGGIEPLLDKNRQFREGQFPFAIIAASGINRSLYSDFCDEWNSLMFKIGRELGISDAVPLHARLMFGKTKPPEYRGKVNPYLRATHDQSCAWFIEGLEIYARYARIRQGGATFSSTASRIARKEHMETAFSTPESLAEGEFLKIGVDRKKYPKLHQKYITHVSAILIDPTFDNLAMINRTMLHCSSSCEAIFDNYSDASGFDDAHVAGYIKDSLQLTAISKTRTVPDTDTEPLCQLADLVAYVTFRDDLRRHRIAQGQNPPAEPMTVRAQEILRCGSLCSADVTSWLRREGGKPEFQRLQLAARYAAAHHQISQYAPDFVSENLKTPQEFEASTLALKGARPPYLPILKPGVLDTWQSTRTL